MFKSDAGDRQCPAIPATSRQVGGRCQSMQSGPSKREGHHCFGSGACANCSAAPRPMPVASKHHLPSESSQFGTRRSTKLDKIKNLLPQVLLGMVTCGRFWQVGELRMLGVNRASIQRSVAH